MGGIGRGRVEVIASKGCSRLFMDFSSSFRGLQSFSLEPMSPASIASEVLESPVKIIKSNCPFSGLVICVTGLSKEARKQVKEATKKMGGQYSSHLHPQLRLNESLYSVNHIGATGAQADDLKRLAQNNDSEKSSPPVGSLEHSAQPGLLGGPHLLFSERETKRRTVASPFSGQSFYVDNDVSAELRSKVAEAVCAEGAILLDQWCVGCDANYIVCEGPSIRKYLGHSSNLVTPAWVLKSAKENRVQRLVHLSTDLARQTGALLDTIENGIFKEEVNGIADPGAVPRSIINISCVERQKIANLAKDGVRMRRNRHMQTCTFFETKEDVRESETSFVNLSRLLTESEKAEFIFKSHFLTILFPIDRFLEMGPRSRTFFSEKGFTCLQVLDYIHTFYQENMSADEIEVAIHTDSRHADQLRLAYSSEETAEFGFVEFKRIDFLGSRISFEMLKRVNGDNNSNVYELLIRA
ncbi:BRCT domain-containing DNA repair protein [Forsythia ovata]|uniref:BRCT domain-containing DNA repair protein n=1 Tax=Forsythia ovata TaxID=205694 RepID=A0ABD1W4X8_9LAMI